MRIETCRESEASAISGAPERTTYAGLQRSDATSRSTREAERPLGRKVTKRVPGTV